MGAHWSTRTRGELEAQIIAALAAPHSAREVFLQVGSTPRIQRLFTGLFLAGKIARVGTRRTFDYGSEVLYRAAHSEPVKVTT
jgi:hypothetical protein